MKRTVRNVLFLGKQAGVIDDSIVETPVSHVLRIFDFFGPARRFG
jgi:hypothetical protein